MKEKKINEQAAINNRFADKEDRARFRRIWLEFKATFPNDKACWNDLVNQLQKDDLLYCRNCYGTDLKFAISKRKYSCPLCKIDGSITSNTFFSRVRKLWAWYAAIWLADHSIIINSCLLADITGIASSSAQHINKSIMCVLAETRTSKTCEVSSIHFFDIIRKRSILTSKLCKPIAEEIEIYDKRKAKEEKASNSNKAEMQDSNTQSNDIKNSGANCQEPVSKKNAAKSRGTSKREAASEKDKKTIHGEQLSPDERLILNLLKRKDMSIEDLLKKTRWDISRLNVALSLLELLGRIKILAGGNVSMMSSQTLFNETCANKNQDERRDCKLSSFFHANKFHSCLIEKCAGRTSEARAKSLIAHVASFKVGIKRIFGGVSRKYLQLYLSLIKCETILQIERGRSEDNTLLKLCLERSYVGSKHIKTVNSPELLSAAFSKPQKAA
jgi:hypothetical protein